MKKYKLIILASSIFITAYACNNSSITEKEKKEIGTSQTEEEVIELIETTKHDIEKQKEETMNELREKRDSIEKSINIYKAKIDNKLIDAKAETRQTANEAISKLEAAKQKVESKMQETQDATEENWDKAKLEAKSFANDVQREADSLTAKIEEMLK